MRRVTYGAAVSLDGYLAGPGEAMDWLRWSPDAAKINQESWSSVDTILMGRKTYEFAARRGGAGGPPNIKNYIFSRTLIHAPEWAELVQTDAGAFLHKLKAEEGGNIVVMGGGELASALLEAGVVDDLALNVHPLLLGDGVPMFRRLASRVGLDLIECRPIAEQCVFLRYAVDTHAGSREVRAPF